jgi:hypothetical protein
LLRQYFPKRRSMAHLRQRHCDVVTRKLNHRPRKRYDYQIPIERLAELLGVALRVLIHPPSRLLRETDRNAPMTSPRTAPRTTPKAAPSPTFPNATPAPAPSATPTPEPNVRAMPV